MTRRSATVVFVAAAGPRRGFGHVIRCGVLADALGVPRVLALRASPSARRATTRLGWTLRDPRTVLAASPALLIVDDPSSTETARWVRRARQSGIPVATVHDGNAHISRADIVIDGSLLATARPGRLTGVRFAILHERIEALRRASRPRNSRRVLIALGGGAYVRRIGVRVARAIVRVRPDAGVELAAGFLFDPRRLPVLPAGCRWVVVRRGLAERLAAASVAVVSGGITLYEACALGTPTVAVAVVPAQRPAILAAAALKAVLVPAHSSAGPDPDAIAAAVDTLLSSPARAADLGQRGRTLVDGAGTRRVAAHLRRLLDRSSGVTRHAA